MLKILNNNIPFRNSKVVLAVLALIVINACLAIIFGLKHSIDIPTFHLDGAYQIASGLYRLADGQWPGKDFFPYLGVGLTFSLYPIFILAGNNIAASVFTSFFFTICGFAMAIGTIAGLLANKNRLLTGLTFSTISLVLVFSLYPDLPQFLLERLTPGNSLRPLRSLIPYIAVVLTYLVIKSGFRHSVIYFLIGGFAGISFLWTNDFGLPTTIFLLAFAILFARSQRVLTFSLILLILGSALFSAATGLAIFTVGHGIELLRYNFIDVRFDQYWYFGPWSEESRIFSIFDIFLKLLPDFGWWSLTLFAMILRNILSPSIERWLVFLIGLILAGGGTLAVIGGHREIGYISHFIFWCKLVLFMELYLYTKQIFHTLFNNTVSNVKPEIKKYISFDFILIYTISAGILVAIANLQVYADEKSLARSDLNRFYVSELGGYLPLNYVNHINMARLSKSSLVIEEYWGLWSAVNRVPSILPVDSVIHALGDTRDFCTSAIQNNVPDIVVTTTRSMSNVWQPWNLSSNYWFYKPLFQQYNPEKTSPTTIVWKRTDPVSSNPVRCEVFNEDSPHFSLPESPPGFYEIKLNMKHISHDSRAMLFVKNNINQVTEKDGYISLNPMKHSYEFPVAIVESRPKVFDLRTVPSRSKIHEMIHLEACEAKHIHFDSTEVFSIKNFAADRTAENHTDDDYLNGVGRKISTFFVPTTPENEYEYTVGKRIRFANGEVRKIINRGVEHRIFILFDGPPLDGNIVGYPYTIEVLK